MNKKLFLILLVVIIATACTPALTNNSGPVVSFVQPEIDLPSVQVPVTGNSAPIAVHTQAEARRWSGEVFLSENDTPDSALNVKGNAEQNACTSDDSGPRRHGGCME